MENRYQVIDVDEEPVEPAPQIIDLTQDDSVADPTRGALIPRRRGAPKRMNHRAAPKRKRPGNNAFIPWPARRESPLPSSSVVTLSDDSDIETPSKKSRLPNEEDGDRSDEDYDACHEGFVANSDRWVPLACTEREPCDRDEDMIMDVDPSEELEMRSVEATLVQPVLKKHRSKRDIPVISMQRPVVAERRSLKYDAIWDLLDRAANISDRQRPSRLRRIQDIYASPMPLASIGRRFAIPLVTDQQPLSLSSSFKQSPGCIMKVIQQDGWAVIGSVCEGGHRDSEQEEQLDAHNRKGSLIVWHKGKENILDKHRKFMGNFGREVYKYYSITDIKFDSTSTSFVSSGEDLTVRVWRRQSNSGSDSGSDEEEEEEEYVQDRVFNCTYVPSGVALKPGTKTLAVAERKLVIHSDYEISVSRHSYNVAAIGAQHRVGSIIWGFGPTAHLICASSEPIDDDCSDGYHKLFDVKEGIKEGKSYDLDAKEAGDTLALMPDGSTLVHTSLGPNRAGIIRLYDIGRKLVSAVETVRMEPFRQRINGEVNSISISPDGIYVAIARGDNRVHVYDSRFFKRGTLFEYEHQGPSLVNPGHHSFGAVGVQWAETEHSRLSLVSGGSDGCVRLWNPLEAVSSPKNGIILAQAHSDVGNFSLGDRTQNEQQLIVGDGSGEIYIYNSTGTYLRPL
ncbi:hypothetical protein APHAL10511_004335 [Amanita phalloides]|nr:hypothetical protein APHAL10511_004335 [Amanita phalloides]